MPWRPPSFGKTTWIRRMHGPMQDESIPFKRDSGMTTLTSLASLDAEALYASLRDQVARLLSELPADQTHLLGIYSGGGWIAQRLHQDLGLASEPGFLNISFYR